MEGAPGPAFSQRAGSRRGLPSGPDGHVRGMSSVTVQAKQAARSPWIERLGVVGWLAKGALYLVMAVLALKIATGTGGGETADQQGALREVADQPFGAVLLGLLALGLAGYGL